MGSRSRVLHVDRPGVRDLITGQLLVGKWTLVHGARATGKSTVLEDVRVELEKQGEKDMKLIVLSIDVGGIGISASGERYWEDFTALVAEALLDWLPSDAPSDLRGRVEAFSSGPGSMKRFQDMFKRGFLSAPFSHEYLRDRKTVFLIDEFSTLFDEYKIAEDKIKSTDASEREQGRNAQNNVAATLDALRSLKNATSHNALHAVAAVGVYSLTDPSVHGRASPFNVADYVGLGNLTEGEVQALFRKYREGHKVDIAEGVVEDIFRLTKGHAGLVHALGKCLTYGKTGQASDKSVGVENLFKGLRVNRAVWEDFAASDEPYLIASEYKSIAAPVRHLMKPHGYYADARKAAARVFLPAELPVRVDGQLEDNARVLCALGFLAEVGRGTFEVASPLMRQILIKKVLPVDYRHYVAKPLPRDPSTGYLDGVGILQILARVLVQEAYLVGRTKDAGGKGATKVQAPHEVCYQLSLGLFLGQWAGDKASVNHEVTFTHSKDETKGKPDFVVVDLAQGERVKGKRIVLELSAHLVDGESGKRDAGDRYPNTVCGHVDKCEEQYAAAKDVVAVYYVNFTTQPEANCYKPEAALRDTTLVHVRHDEEGKVLGMLVLRPGKTKWERPKVPSIEDSKSVSVKSLGLQRAR